jgi:hypothetical protein
MVPQNQEPELLTITSPDTQVGRTADVAWTELSGKVTPPGPTLTGTAYANEEIKSSAIRHIHIVTSFDFISTPFLAGLR